MSFRAFVLVCVALPLSPALRPATADERLTPERVFSDPAIDGPTAREVQISPDGQLVTWLKGKEENQNVLDLWAADMRGGAPFRLIDARALMPQEHALSEAEKSRRERMRVTQHGIVEYHWDEEGKFILVPLSGDLFLADRATRAVRRLTDTKPDEVDSKVSPHGHLVSFVPDQ